MKQGNINFKASTLHYYVFGEGGQYVFCFHGYGETGKSFEVLEPYLGKNFTLVALDLPFHGETEWNEGLLFTPKDLAEIIQKIYGDSNAPIWLLGFSLGGRIALNLLPLFVTKVETVVLLAPDGLQENFWYWLATKTKAGNAIFKKAMQKPALLFSLLSFSRALRLMQQSNYKFVHYYIDYEDSRLLLYKRWTAFKKFSANIHVIKDAVFDSKANVTLVFGTYDKIITHKAAKYFADGLESQVTIKQVEAGHQLLKEKYAELIAGFFYK